MRVGVCAGVSRIWLRGNEVRSSRAKDNEDGKILQMYATATNGLCVCVESLSSVVCECTGYIKKGSKGGWAGGLMSLSLPGFLARESDFGK